MRAAALLRGATRLVSGATAQAGNFIGPASDPHRYRLLQLLSGPSHAVLKVEDAPTVWEAQEILTNRPVIVKVVRADMSPTFGALEGIATLLSRVAGRRDLVQRDSAPPAPSPHPGQKHCVAILDSFSLPWSETKEASPPENENDHDTGDAAVVLEPLGPSLSTWQKERSSPFLPLNIAGQIMRQVLLAVEYLHEGLVEGKIAHLGISLDNLLLEQSSKRTAPENDASTQVPQVKLTGFSTSLLYDEEYEHRTLPSDWLVASPEQMLTLAAYGDYGPARATDIWQIGVLASSLLFDKNLALPDFNLSTLFSPCNYGNKLQRFSLAGPAVLSLASLDREAGWPLLFDETNLFQHDPAYPFDIPGVVPLPSLRDRILAEPASSSFTPSQIDLLTSFLRACWTLDPYKRPSARELLEHEWLKGGEEEKQ